MSLKRRRQQWEPRCEKCSPQKRVRLLPSPRSSTSVGTCHCSPCDDAIPPAAVTNNDSPNEAEQNPVADVNDRSTCCAKVIADSGVDPIQHWVEHSQWPSGFHEMAKVRSVSPKKRLRSSSYSQSVQDGDVPRPYSQAYEKVLADAGIYMEESKGRALLRPVSRDLCKQMRSKRYEEPQYTAIPLSSFLSLWERVRNRNEARIYRDLTPLLVPSPELLALNGESGLDSLVEEINTEWKCMPLAGPKPKPDFAVGLPEAAFDDEERAKLKNYSSIECPVQFTDHLLFPFLLCEAKSGDQAIDRADRQNAHSASMAVRAIIQLYRALGEDKVLALNGQILVFSVSHDNKQVNIYGHFASITDERTTFHRYMVASSILNIEDGPGRKQTYDFVREVYHSFYPQHLERIRDALKEMKDPRAQSVTSALSQVELGVAELGETATSSALGADVFKLPGTPASQQTREELNLLRDQLERQEKQSREQLTRMEQMYKEQMVQQEKQMAQQEKLYKEQMTQQEKQYKEQVARQEKQYKDQVAQQEKLMAQQEKQYKEQIDLLKQLLNRE